MGQKRTLDDYTLLEKGRSRTRQNHFDFGELSELRGACSPHPLRSSAELSHGVTSGCIERPFAYFYGDGQVGPGRQDSHPSKPPMEPALAT